MAKLFIGVGHGGPDPGAVAGSFRESDANLYIALGLADELIGTGIEYKMSRTVDEEDRLIEEIAECKEYNPDIAVEIHCNAGGGEGFEVYYQTGSTRSESIKLAQCIEARVKATGQKSRGLKTKYTSSGTDYFGWLRQLSCPAVLTEGFFVDNATDRAKYDTEEELRALGRAHAHGILDYFGVTKPEDPILYRVQVGAFRDRGNAEDYMKAIKEMGYPAYIVEVHDKNDSR